MSSCRLFPAVTFTINHAVIMIAHCISGDPMSQSLLFVVCFVFHHAEKQVKCRKTALKIELGIMEGFC